MTTTEADKVNIAEVIKRRTINYPKAPWIAVGRLAYLAMNEEPPIPAPNQTQAKTLFAADEFIFDKNQLREIIRLTTQVLASVTHG